MSNSSVQITPVSPNRCVVCADDDREAIDRALIRRERTQADVARQLGVDRSTISRHFRNHVLPALASAMVSSSADISMGSVLAEFDHLYGTNRQIQEVALARDDLRLARDMSVERRKLLEVLLKNGDKIGAGSVTDAIGIDRDRWAQLDRETSARYAEVARQEKLKFARALTMLADLKDDVRDRIMNVFLRGQLSAEELAALDKDLVEEFGYEWPGDDDPDQAN